jgi:N-acetylglucosamine kinase-like BadF-type ATPase
VGIVVGVDGGNSKTDVVVARVDGEPLAYLRGGGSNAHGPRGAAGCIDVIDSIVARAALAEPAVRGAFFLCGADVPSDFEALAARLRGKQWVEDVVVENDTVALLHAGTDAENAVAVVCGAGINVVGRGADGRVARYPSLGWETGDWGGSEMLGREVLFHAARAEDGRGEPTMLEELVRSHFGLSVPELGEELHFRRMRVERLGELAGPVVEAAGEGDAVARRLIDRLADEIVLLAWKALRDLELLETDADVVLGGGMLQSGAGYLHQQVVTRLERRAPRARAVVASDPPVVGAAIAALQGVGEPSSAERLRKAFRRGVDLEDVRG